MNYKTIDQDRPLPPKTSSLKSYNNSKISRDDNIRDQINILKLSIIGNSKINNIHPNTKLKSSYISETTRNKINQIYNMTSDTSTIKSISPIRTNRAKQSLIPSKPVLSIKRNDFKDHIKNIEVIKLMQRRITKDN
jgi:hypothetical protein